MPSNYHLMKKNSWYSCLEKNGKCPPKVIPKTKIEGNLLTPGMRYSRYINNYKGGTVTQVKSEPAINKNLKFELAIDSDDETIFIGIKDNDKPVVDKDTVY
jgi:hypothetical protein